MTTWQRLRLPARFMRFTLRNFLIVTIVTGTASGFIVNRVLYVAHVMKCVPEIEQHGVQVLSDFHERYGLYASDHHGERLELVEWCFSNPEYINVMYCNRQSTDVLVETLSTLHTVKRINAAHITASGLRSISRLTNLESLQLQDSAVNDETLELFLRLPRLRQLNISNSKITDRGLYRLAQMLTLKELYLQNANVTTAALEQLDKTRPDLKVFATFVDYGQGSVYEQPK
jgi:hypothetical protein